MEFWGFAVMVVGAAVALLVMTRLLGRTDRNTGATHGGGYSWMSDTTGG